MAGSQHPLESLPGSRVLGVESRPERIDVVVCGPTNAGKTALITSYCIGLFVTGYDPTLEQLSSQRIFNTTPYVLDFPELSASWVLDGETSALKKGLKQSDVLLFAYDVGDRESFEKMKEIYEKVLAAAGEGLNVPVGIVATKSDTSKEEWQVEAEEGREFASRIGGVFAACSAKEGEGVQDAVEGPVLVLVEGKRKLLKEREERDQGRNKSRQERAERDRNTGTVMDKVRRWLHFGKR